MQFAKRFLAKFSSLIITILSCFDRVIFKGYLPFGNEGELNSGVDYTLRIRRCDFITLLKKRSEELVTHAKQIAEKAGRPYEYRQGKFRKEKFIQDIIRNDRLTEGLVAVICVQETCRTIQLAHGAKRPRLIFTKCPHRVVYYYYLGPEFGLMHIRLETWFPYTIQVYVNPARKDDVRLFQAVLSGDHELRGFHNSDIRSILFRTSGDPVEPRRRANAVSRLLKRLHIRGLIARIPRTRRWKVTAKGQSILGAIIRLHYHGIPLAV